MSKSAFTLHYVSTESCFGFGSTHTRPAAETGQELETTGKGDGERGRERQQEDTQASQPLASTPSPLHSGYPPGPKSTQPHTDTLTHMLTHSPSGLGMGAGSPLR